MSLQKTFLTFFSSIALVLAFSYTTLAAGSVVATVNITDAAVTSQEGHIINGVFTLSNREGVQTGVRYGVQLISGTGKDAFVADEKIFDEIVDLPENTSLRKGFSYTAPDALSGSYTLVVMSRNSTNFPFASSVLGNVVLSGTAQGIVIAPQSCGVRVGTQAASSISQTVAVSDASKKVEVVCSVTNTAKSDITVTRTIQTKFHSAYGDVVETAPIDATPILFKAGEKKTVTFAIPLAGKPKTYRVTLALSNEQQQSNTIGVTYLLAGDSATIANISLDKDVYRSRENAVATLVWYGGSPDMTVEATLTNSLGMNCAKPINQKVLASTSELTFPITSMCRNPHVVATFKDAKGNVLDEKDVTMETTSTGRGNGMVLIGVAVVLLFAGVWSYFKKHKKTTMPPRNGMPFTSVLAIVVLTGLLSLIPFNKVSADTYTSAGPGGSQCIWSEVNVVPDNYAPNTDINVTWRVVNNCTSAVPVAVRAVNNVGLGASNPSADLMTPETLAANGGHTGIMPRHNDFSFDAPANGGTYAIKFETGVDVSTGDIYVRVVEVSDDYWETPSGNFCGDSQASVYFGHRHTVYRAEFYSDAGGTIPLDVSGRNLRLKQTHHINIPTWVSTVPGTETTYTGVLSGTSYTYDGPSYDESFTDGWGSSSCDIQTNVYGYETLDGASVTPTPYLFVLTPPIASITGPNGVYTGESFTLSWNSSPSTSCVGTNFSTGGAGQGSVNLTMNGTNTYTVNCSNVLGSASDSVTVEDWGTPPPPPQTCNGWPGQAIACDSPMYCAADPSHPGYEVCQF